MNSSLFSYPAGRRSLERTLAERGFEVWAVDLRGQGDSFRLGIGGDYGLRDLGITDLGRVLEHINARKFSQTSGFHGVGCSLGASLLYLYLSVPHPVSLRSLTCIAGPLRWEKAHPLVRLLFASPRLAGALPIRGSRQVARIALPWLLRIPRILSPYMNATMVERRDVQTFVRSVEDPSPRMNREIAEWLTRGELEVDGQPLSHHIREADLPFLCILARADGIVPPATVRSAWEEIGSRNKKLLEIGTPAQRFAHADLFISRHACRLVFEPLTDWLGTVESNLAPATTGGSFPAGVTLATETGSVR